MKLHQPGEPRVSRPKASEVLGPEEQTELVGFDPHQDIPEEIRERYIIYLDLRPMRGYEWQPAMDLATYLGIAMLFPDQREGLRKRLGTVDKTKNQYCTTSPTGMMKAAVLLQLVFPREAAKEQDFFDQAWDLAKRTATLSWTIEDLAILLAWTRLAVPDRFAEVAPTSSDWKEMKAALQESLMQDRSRRVPKSLRFAFSLYILAAEEVAVVPGVGIKVRPTKQRLGSTPNLPDRPHV
ncbi:MAG: hypothetical protein AAB558_02000 [Patescibacteria group bacterium]